MNYFLWTVNKKTYKRLISADPTADILRLVYVGQVTPRPGDLVKFNNFNQVFYIDHTDLAGSGERHRSYIISLRPDEIKPDLEENLLTLSDMFEEAEEAYLNTGWYPSSESEALLPFWNSSYMARDIFVSLVNKYQFRGDASSAWMPIVSVEEYWRDIIPGCFDGDYEIYAIYDDAEQVQDLIAAAVVELRCKSVLHVYLNAAEYGTDCLQRAAELLVEAISEDLEIPGHRPAIRVLKEWAIYFEGAAEWYSWHEDYADLESDFVHFNLKTIRR